MAQFKKGDRVRIVDSDKLSHIQKNYVNEMGTVDQDDSAAPWVIMDKDRKRIFYTASKLELIPTTIFKAGGRVIIHHRNPDNKTGAVDWMEPNGDAGVIGFIAEDIGVMQKYPVRSRPGKEQGQYYGWFTANELRLAGDKTPGTQVDHRILQVGGPDGLKELDTITHKEKPMETKKKTYRLLQDTPQLEAGAILVKDGSNYEPIDTLWDTDAYTKAKDKGSNIVINGTVVENSPTWYEQVFETSWLGKKVYQTKEAAKAEAAKLFKNK